MTHGYGGGIWTWRTATGRTHGRRYEWSGLKGGRHEPSGIPEGILHCAKIGFLSRADARKQMRKVKGGTLFKVAASADSGRLYVYECSACELFHLTHKTRGRKR